MSEFEGKYRQPEEGQSVEQEVRIPEPCNELAWMLGVLSGGWGYVKTDGGKLTAPTKYEELTRVFGQVAGDLFELEPVCYKSEYNKDKVEFSSGRVLSFLGNLSQKEWPETLMEKHSWLLENDNFIWAFLGGYFDARGHVLNPKVPGNTCSLIFSARSRAAADGIAAMLKQLKFDRWGYNKGEGGSDYVASVGLYNFSDVRKFAVRVRSCVSEKEVVLAEYREMKSIIGLKEKGRIPLPSTDFAWILGVLSGKGYVGDYSVAKRGGGRALMMKFSVGERLFGLASKLSTKDGEISGVTFNSVELADHLGDLRLGGWPQTLRDKHDWVYGDESFMLAFLEGYYDVKGNTTEQAGNNTQLVKIGVKNKIAANELLVLFARIGFSSVDYSRSRRGTSEGITGVVIRDVGESVNFAGLIHSCVPEKEKLLAFCRNKSNYDLVYTGNPEVLEAYDLVMRLREETGFGARRLLKLPEMQKFSGLIASTVAAWINMGRNSRRSARFVKRRSNLTSDEIKRGIVLLDSDEEPIDFDD